MVSRAKYEILIAYFFPANFTTLFPVMFYGYSARRCAVRWVVCHLMRTEVTPFPSDCQPGDANKYSAGSRIVRALGTSRAIAIHSMNAIRSGGRELICFTRP